jgi:hypothetical protein
VNPQSAGRPHRHPNPGRHVSKPWIPVASQQFVHRGRGSQRFAVITTESDEAEPAPVIHRWEERQQAMKQEIIRQQAQIEQEEQARIMAHEPREVNPWVERAGWAEHLIDEDRRTLLPLIEKVNPETEPVLNEICQRFDRIIAVAQHTVLRQMNIFSRFEINRKQVGIEPRQPFNARMDPGTMDHYRQVWRRMISYIIRSTQDPEGEMPTRFRLTYPQQTTMRQMIQAIENGPGQEDCQEDGMNRPNNRQIDSGVYSEIESESEVEEHRDRPNHGRVDRPIHEPVDQAVNRQSDQPNDGADPAQPPLTAIDRRILAWCVELLDHPLTGSQGQEFESAIISGLAVMGIRQDGGWETALDFTPKLSAMIKLARMLVAQQAWEQNQSSGGDCLEDMREMIQRFMTTTNATPMKWMFDTRTYGLKIRYMTTADGLVDWQGDQITYQHYRFTMDQFKSMMHGLVQRAWDHLMTEVLLFPADVADAPPLPGHHGRPCYRRPAEVVFRQGSPEFVGV